MPTPNKPLPAPLPPSPLAPGDPQALPVLTDAQLAGADPVPERSAPALPSMPVPERAISPDQWAAEKGTPDWALAAARARHLQPGQDSRAGWLPNGVMTETAFDDALTLTLDGELR